MRFFVYAFACSVCFDCLLYLFDSFVNFGCVFVCLVVVCCLFTRLFVCFLRVLSLFVRSRVCSWVGWSVG